MGRSVREIGERGAGEFVRAQEDVRGELTRALSRALDMPDPAWWQEQAAAFREGEEERPAAVTVDPLPPLEREGERLGVLRRFFRRLIRRCIRWYIEPVVEAQNAVNRALLRTLEEQEKRIRELEARIEP